MTSKSISRTCVTTAACAKNYRRGARLVRRAARHGVPRVHLKLALGVQIWSDAFAEQHGRRPDKKDVNDTRIPWLVRPAKPGSAALVIG